MIHITATPEDKAKLFSIYGWLSDGRPVTRTGTQWIAMSGQSRDFYNKAQALQPGEDAFLLFKTSAGYVGYRLKRIK